MPLVAGSPIQPGNIIATSPRKQTGGIPTSPLVTTQPVSAVPPHLQTNGLQIHSSQTSPLTTSHPYASPVHTPSPLHPTMPYEQAGSQARQNSYGHIPPMMNGNGHMSPLGKPMDDSARPGRVGVMQAVEEEHARPKGILDLLLCRCG